MTHDVGIRVVGNAWGKANRPRPYRAFCRSCGWEGVERAGARKAQADAIGHQGGTLRTAEEPTRPTKPEPSALGMAEMFPGVR